MNVVATHPFRDRTALVVYGVMGCVSLIYQLSWTRQLTTLLGSTVSAIAMITALFMVGMAMGSWAAGRLSDLRSNALRSLSRISIALGVSGALAVPLYGVVARVHASGALASRSALFGVALLLAATVTLVPTAFVGAGFPVVGRTLSMHRKDIGLGASSAYVAGTLGSVAGALLGGFVLVPAVGVNATILIASATAVATGLACYALGRRADAAPVLQRPAHAETPGTNDMAGIRVRTLLAFTLSGASIMVYETVWTRELLLVFGPSVYAVATMLSAALTGLALGQWLGGKNRQERAPAAGTVGMLQVAGAGAAMLSLLLVRAVPLAYYTLRGFMPGGVAGFIATQFLLSFVVIAAPCMLLGATAPIAIRLCTSSPTTLGRDIGFAYALNTAGAVVGSLTGGLVLMPAFSTVGSAGVAAGANLVAGAVMLRTAWRSSGVRLQPSRLVSAVVTLILGLTSLLTVSSAPPILDLATRPAIGSASAGDLLQLAKITTVVYARDPLEGRVAVLESPDGTLSLRASGMNEGGTAQVDEGDSRRTRESAELVVKLPHAMVGDSSDILVVGLGTGTTTDYALGLPSEPHVDTVEINPAIIDASRYFVEPPLDQNPRSTIIVDDARHYFMNSTKRYDIIASQPSLPLSTYSARLFTRESFIAASGMLKPDGVMVQWLPASLMDDSDLNMMIKTFSSAFKTTEVWMTVDPDHPDSRFECVMAGRNGLSDTDIDSVLERLRGPADSATTLTYWMGPDEVAGLTADENTPLNTDDRPAFEYRMPVIYVRWIWADGGSQLD